MFVLQETCILYFYEEICGIPENVPRFLKNAFHITENAPFRVGISEILSMLASSKSADLDLHCFLKRIYPGSAYMGQSSLYSMLSQHFTEID